MYVLQWLVLFLQSATHWLEVETREEKNEIEESTRNKRKRNGGKLEFGSKFFSFRSCLCFIVFKISCSDAAFQISKDTWEFHCSPCADLTLTQSKSNSWQSVLYSVGDGQCQRHVTPTNHCHDFLLQGEMDTVLPKKWWGNSVGSPVHDKSWRDVPGPAICKSS